MGQWLGLCVSTAGSVGSIPGQAQPEKKEKKEKKRVVGERGNKRERNGGLNTRDTSFSRLVKMTGAGCLEKPETPGAALISLSLIGPQRSNCVSLLLSDMHPHPQPPDLFFCQPDQPHPMWSST